jgi:hypothetical protein
MAHGKADEESDYEEVEAADEADDELLILDDGLDAEAPTVPGGAMTVAARRQLRAEYRKLLANTNGVSALQRALAARVPDLFGADEREELAQPNGKLMQRLDQVDELHKSGACTLYPRRLTGAPETLGARGVSGVWRDAPVGSAPPRPLLASYAFPPFAFVFAQCKHRASRRRTRT